MNEIPYWETINRYLEKPDPDGLQDIICRLCERLIRGRAFEDARIRGKYWQVIIDGTQLRSSRGELDDRTVSLSFPVHPTASFSRHSSCSRDREFWYFPAPSMRE